MRRTVLGLVSHGALCFHAAPLTNIGHVDQAVGTDDGFTVHRRHPPLTCWAVRVRFSAKTTHIVTGSRGAVTTCKFSRRARAPRRWPDRRTAVCSNGGGG